MSPTATQPLVYFFGQGRADGSAAMKDILGGKGAALAEMTSIGVSVPPGFTIASTLCQTYLQTRAFPGGLRAQVEACLNRLEAATRRQFGGATKPLLVSVRSGAALSMPGMMETILNLGLNDATVVALERESGNPQFAWDSYRRSRSNARAATRNSRGTVIGVLYRCTPPWCTACRKSVSRPCSPSGNVRG